MTDTQINYADARRTMVDCQIRPSDVTRFPIPGGVFADRT